MYRWGCTYCDKVISADTPGGVTTQARDHLSTAHRADVIAETARTLTDAVCHGCGTSLAGEPDTSITFVCPECGHDNFDYFAGKQVWAEVEKA